MPAVIRPFLTSRTLRHGFSRATALRPGISRWCSAKAESLDADGGTSIENSPVSPSPLPDSVNKVGSASPWAVFNASPEEDVSEAEKKLLENASVAIPMSPAEEASQPSHQEILKAYEAHLQRRSSTHLGYPYNLTHEASELNNFMRYSINNLGDPFEPSNYGVHSRQFEVVHRQLHFFAELRSTPTVIPARNLIDSGSSSIPTPEVAVIDFFAKLWKIDQGDYWGYVTTCGTEGDVRHKTYQPQP